MDKTKISSFQLFALVYLFEMGSAILVGIGASARQDAWIVLLLGMISGLLMFLIYYRLFLYYPDLPLTSYIQKLTGDFIGRILCFIYIIYFIYDASRVLRDFGELLTTTIYTNTPLLVINMLMILTSMYAIIKGLEVLVRVGELFFIIVYLISIVGFILVVFSGLIHLEYLKPFLENGYIPVIKSTMRESILYPFGEMIVFSMILPQINEYKKAKKICLTAILLSGINIIITTIINITVLGVDSYIRSPFPLLNTVRSIPFGRLDVLFMLYLVIGGFFKVTVFFYAAVYGVVDLFQIKNPRTPIFPIGLLILFASIAIAINSAEHFKEGLNVKYIYYPLEIFIPFFLFIIAHFKNRNEQLKVKS
ncbi:GerAB/ArcD/ProY family transporter [Neobacillus cucumis]|uniref:GerAB/ArcD/ProY family transporter n=1 Tax=Neobacillus cucumis TaxID=1740721 RepID=UPI0019631CEA|nr:GerAB/ArcD/ProY family transporter [Neobacillus cucumis]MBM7652107.1 spore germination protein KB [Neobacillus cucumis]